MKQATILEQIIAQKEQEVKTAKAAVTLADLESQFPPAEHFRSFSAAMRNRVQSRQIAVIAEIKKASPSIEHDFSSPRKTT
jgi:indole-3-glycerol phosphate synthase